MLRSIFLTPTLLLCACASELPCRTWMPASSGAAPTAGAPAISSAADAPNPVPSDGTRLLEAADPAVALLGETTAPPPPSPSTARAAPAASKPQSAPKPAQPKAEASAKPAVAKAGATPKISDGLLAEANKFYAGRCVPCHGTQGRGDGPAGGALNPHPRNFTDRAWQGAVTDAHIEKTILQGGPSVGKSPLMPPHADLNGKPELLAAMRTVIRGFGR
jgi:hypothetical protein